MIAPEKNDFNVNLKGKKIFFSDKEKNICYDSQNTFPEVTNMFRNLFHADSGLMITMSQITDCIFLSLFFLLGCFPVITAGASVAALYDAAFRGLRKGDKHCWKRFWEVYRKNLKASILPALLVLLGIAGLGKVMIHIWNGAVAGTSSWAAFSAAAVLAVLAAGILSIVFPMLSRFENSSWDLIRNAVFMGMANLPRTMALGFVNAAAFLLCLVYVLPLFILPCLAALVSSWLIEPMFKPYLPETNEG